MTKHKVSPTIDSQTDVEKRVSPTSLSARKGKSGISRDSSSVRNDAATVSITECQALKLPKRKGRKTVRKKIAVRDLFSTCVAPKGGSTSWYELREKLKQHRFEGNTQAAILSVRHPLSRLTSAYRRRDACDTPWEIESQEATRPWQAFTYDDQGIQFEMAEIKGSTILHEDPNPGGNAVAQLWNSLLLSSPTVVLR
ncbi:hypothetical protein C7M84_010479 [Penaeus vannamei]|uniref:Uncharacterized protein n=1 Tax=Penaeus vannamei TaxID=6689 RepID=A0A3R7PMD9_PENVA|nr:hypothetical protein C7M84_010479 [Penaeus vannamei]